MLRNRNVCTKCTNKFIEEVKAKCTDLHISVVESLKGSCWEIQSSYNTYEDVSCLCKNSIMTIKPRGVEVELFIERFKENKEIPEECKYRLETLMANLKE